jgi:hypothetical protein
MAEKTEGAETSDVYGGYVECVTLRANLEAYSKADYKH